MTQEFFEWFAIIHTGEPDEKVGKIIIREELNDI